MSGLAEFKVVEYDGRLVTESRLIADAIGKRHDHLMRDIKGYMQVLNDSPNLGSENFFIEATYVNERNKIYDCFLLTKAGCSMVANKLTGAKGVLFTAQYVTRFEEMENELKRQHENQFALPTTYKEALLQLVEQVEINEQINHELSVTKPKAQYLDNVIQNTNLLTVTQIAKDYGMSGTAMNKKLHELGIQYKSGKNWLLYSNYQDKDYTSSYTEIKNGNTFTHTRWTQEGKKFICELMKGNGILTTAEKNSKIPLLQLVK